MERTTTFGTARDGGARNWYVWSNRGEVLLGIYRIEYHKVVLAADDDGPTPSPFQWLTFQAEPRLTVAYASIKPPYGWHFAGFAYGRYTSPTSPTSSDGSWLRTLLVKLAAPHWFIALVLGTPPAVLLCGRLRRHRRRRAGLCPTCGYDLRATSDRCPECGTASSLLRPPIS